MAGELIPHISLKDISSPNSPYRTSAETIDRNSPQGLIAINHLAGEIFATHDLFSEERETLGTTDDARQLTIRAATNHQFPSQDTVTAEQYERLLDASHRKEQIARGLILQHLQEGARFGLEPHEVDVLATACELGEVYDKLCFMWREDVQDNPVSQKIKKGAEAMEVAGQWLLGKLGLNDQYTILEGDTVETSREVPWAEQYPNQITALAARWIELAERLGSYTDNADAQALGAYFAKYADAFLGKTSSPTYAKEEVAELWRDVDRKWMDDVRERMQPVSAREFGYYDPNHWRAFPDFCLVVRVEGMDEEMQRTQAALQRHLGAQFGDTEVYQATANALNTVQLYPGTVVVRAGALDFAAAGQSLPNEAEVAKEKGTKVFANAEVLRERWDLAMGLARKVFKREEDMKLFEGVDPDYDGVGIFLAGHEYGEPLFQTEEVDKTLGMETKMLLNEDLANLCISGIMRRRVAEGELPQETLLNHAVFLLGTYLRNIEGARGVSFLQPYYVGHALQGLRRMIDSGFISQDKSIDWTINPESLDGLYEQTEADLVTHVAIAEQKDVKGAAEYLSQAKETPSIQDIILRINPDAKFAA